MEEVGWIECIVDDIAECRFDIGRACGQFGGDRSQDQLRQRILDLASQFDLPITEDDFSVRRDDSSHTHVDGSYTQPVELLPTAFFAI